VRHITSSNTFRCHGETTQSADRMSMWQALLLFEEDDDRKYRDSKYQYQPLEIVTFEPTGEMQS
jgi:hypothetical protein